MKCWMAAWIVTSMSFLAFAQDSFDAIEAEINSAQGKPSQPPPTQVIPPPEIQKETVVPTTPSVQPRPSARPAPRREYRAQADPENEISRPRSRSRGSLVDEEMRIQDRILKNKESNDPEISTDRDVDRFPQPQPVFKKPPGPKEGGSVRVEHPRAAEGLMRINKDGSYQYKTPLGEKSQSGSVRAGMMTPPVITTGKENITYETMYGTDNLYGFEGDYTWQPFRSFGALGLKLGGGFATVSGSGFFKNYEENDGRGERSQESYDLYIVPVSAFVEYRFEYVRRQWVVPYIMGGGTYYGLMELRDDGADPTFSGAPAVGGGGGLLLSISRLDSAGAFTLSKEYGIADMWLVLEARVMQGLSEDIDFTNQSVSAGIAVDF